jgi:hypothetical protein
MLMLESFLQVHVLDFLDSMAQEHGAEAAEFFDRVGSEEAQAGLAAALSLRWSSQWFDPQLVGDRARSRFG